jgi:peptide-methionine (S)-S-oxide reductase
MIMRNKFFILSILVLVAIYFFLLRDRSSFTVPEQFPVLDTNEIDTANTSPSTETEIATFGSGCFWCTEAVFERLKGVSKVESGYSGGTVENPTYEAVCDGTTGHAEVVQITFDPKQITYAELLEVFWRSHDPTTKDRQGNDYGTQYRSAIFTHSDQQQKLAELYKRKIDAAGVYSNPIVTEITPFQAFYPATMDHQNFFASNPQYGYCRVVIQPKIEKLQAVFRDKLKLAE